MFFRNHLPKKVSCRCLRNTLVILRRYQMELKPWSLMHHRPCHKVPRPSHSKTRTPLPSHHQRSRTGNHRASSKASLQPMHPHRIISCSLCSPRPHMAWITARCSTILLTHLSAGQDRPNIGDKYPSLRVARTSRAIRNGSECITIPLLYQSIRCVREAGQVNEFSVILSFFIPQFHLYFTFELPIAAIIYTLVVLDLFAGDHKSTQLMTPGVRPYPRRSWRLAVQQLPKAVRHLELLPMCGSRYS